MFKKIVLASCFFASLLMFWGCPYSSTVPLGKPVELVQDNLLGSWISELDANLKSPDYYAISKFDSTHYGIDHFQYNEEEEDYSIKNYIGHTTSLDGLIFMNLAESGKTKYLIHRISLTPDGFTFYEVTDNLDETFDDSSEMQAFFRKHMRLSFFYNKDEVRLVRK